MAALPVQFASIYGVDFSGAKLAGRTTWVARLERSRSGHVLTDLARLEDVCGSAERESALPFLVRLIRASAEALWALDSPCGQLSRPAVIERAGDGGKDPEAEYGVRLNRALFT